MKRETMIVPITEEIVRVVMNRRDGQITYGDMCRDINEYVAMAYKRGVTNGKEMATSTDEGSKGSN